jgi:hypothetical protein
MENYGVKSYRTMGKELKRTPGAVKGKVKRMKIGKQIAARVTEPVEIIKETEGDVCAVPRRHSPPFRKVVMIPVIGELRRLLNPFIGLSKCRARNHYILRRSSWA